MSDATDECGNIIDPAEAYQDFMLRLYDILDRAVEADYASDAIDSLRKARLLFMDEFEARHPGYGQGRAIWR